jgi:Chitobiase/beta-hexosaminidase C-terminal domain
MHFLGKLILAAPLLALATPLMANVLVNSPVNDSTVTTPVHYTASATTTTCSKGVGSMGVYVDNKLIDVVDGAKLSVSLPVAPGKHETVVEEWDHCGGATFTKLAITVGAPPPIHTATPAFSLAPGTYNSAQSVSLSDATAGAKIYYTTNGSTPTTSSTQYSSAISVAASETIEAIAVATGCSTSAVASANYTITPPAATPTFSVAGGTYTSAQTVSLSDATAGATIYYTTNGSTPTTSSTQYSGAISVAASETIKAVALATGYSTSAVASASYTLSGTAATPTFSLASGNYSSPQTVTLSDATAGATIYYTTNGSTPTTSSTQYSGAISVTASETIEAVAVATGYSNSGLASVDYNIGGSYYLAPAEDGGNDANDGLSPDSPWLTPNHSLNCGDVITAASGTYAPGNFEGTFGTVTGTGHCVAILKCATFDTCFSIGTGNDPSNGLIWVSKSHWAVMGFEVQNPSATSGNSSCFKASPLSAATITDVAFINDIANGCGMGGFAVAPYYGGGSYGVDYFTLIADIAYNAAQSNNECASGVSIWEPINYDTLPGTHTYVSQYFGWGNVEPSVCGGTAATDGEGLILDTLNAFSYSGQVAVEDSITTWNGSSGVEAFASDAAPIYIQHVTSYANGSGPGLNHSCGEIENQNSTSPLNTLVQISANIAKTNASTGCGPNPYYAYLTGNVTSNNDVDSNVGYSPSGSNTNCWGTCTGFSFGPNNTFGTDPDFDDAPTSAPDAPSCGSSSSTIACVAPIIAGFVPRNTGMSSYGYQPPSSTPNSDPLFPQWLCKYSNQLNGLVTMGCSAQ